jgi:hypothetical protein
MNNMMTTTTIRKRLHNFLESANERKIKALYVMVEHEINNNEVEYSEELKVELDRRVDNYNTGKSKPVSAIESKNRIQNILKSAGKK